MISKWSLFLGVALGCLCAIVECGRGSGGAPRGSGAGSGPRRGSGQSGNSGPGLQATAGRKGKGPQRQILPPQARSRLQDLYRLTAKRRGKDISLLASDSLTWTPPENWSDGTEASLNADVAHDLFENDIRLTLPQINELVAAYSDRRRHKRKLSASGGRWGRTIPYTFASSISSSAARDIRIGLNDWEEHTCLRFVQNGAGADSLTFFNGGGCYSYIGRTGGEQEVSIGDGCQQKGIVSHEVGHALGLWHEQSRHDRDNFIKVMFRNIFDQSLGNFEKRRSNQEQSFGIPYDLGSVMHYGPRAFVKVTNLFAIKTLDSRYQNTIGQREGISFIDAKMINEAYCSKVCRNSLSCEHGGYPDPNDCNRCKCPRGLGGNCDRAGSSSSGCGGNLAASSTVQSISSTRVEPSQTCSWHIKSNNGEKIRLQLQKISYPCSDTCSNYLEVKFNSDFQQSGARFCCDVPSSVIESETGEMVLIHVTGSSIGSRYDGFQGNYYTSGTTAFKLTPAPPTERPEGGRTKGRTDSGIWSYWSGWSVCSEECGGCGQRQRVRRCEGQRCSGSNRELEQCNSQPCTRNGESRSCSTRLSVPCNFTDTSPFDPRTASFPVQGIPNNLPQGGTVTLIDTRQRTRRPRPVNMTPPPWFGKGRGGAGGGKGGGGRGGGGRGGGGRGGGGKKGGRGKRQTNMCRKKFQYQCGGGSVTGSCCGNFSLQGSTCRANRN